MKRDILVLIVILIFALFRIAPANAEPPTTEARNRITYTTLNAWAHAAIDDGRSATIVRPHQLAVDLGATTRSDHWFELNTNGLFITIVFGSSELEEDVQSTRCLYLYYSDDTNECIRFNRSNPTFGFLDFGGPALVRMDWEKRAPTQPPGNFYWSTTRSLPALE